MPLSFFCPSPSLAYGQRGEIIDKIREETDSIYEVNKTDKKFMVKVGLEHRTFSMAQDQK